MTSIASWLARAPASERVTAQPSAGLRFDWVSVMLSAWLVGGAYLDGWAHNHLRSTLESFFTPWHAVLYSGFLASALFLVGAHTRNVLRGCAWSRALPAGYGLSLLGAIAFALGGVGDLIWHTLFGIEVNVEALLSPTHHLLVVGVALMVSGAFRATWQRADERAGWRAYLPLILSATLTWSIITFIMQGVHPFTYPAASARFAPRTNLERDAFQMLGLAQIIVQTGLLMGLILLMLRRWGARLPVGTFTLMFTLNALAMSTQLYEFRFIPVMVLGGIGADLLLWGLKPGSARITQARLCAFSAPLALFALYFVSLALTDQIWWKVHSVMGSIFAAGVTGLLLSYLVFPPAIPSEAP